MGIMESLKNWFQTQRSSNTLNVSIDEISQQRD
jgi:hypothetical protein